MKITFINALLLLFIGLKLIGKISWTWWWVLSPLWITLTILLLCFIYTFCRFIKNEGQCNERN